MDELDLAVATGDISPSQYDMLTGGSYAAQQTAFDSADNGTVQNSAAPFYNGGVIAANPSAASNPPPANGGSSYTPPSWLTTLTGLATVAGQAATSLNPIINGKPATSPGAAGQSGTPAPASKNNVLILAGVGVLALLFLSRD